MGTSRLQCTVHNQRPQRQLSLEKGKEPHPMLSTCNARDCCKRGYFLLKSISGVGPFQAANHLMQHFRPLQLEAWICLSAKRISWACSSTKKYIHTTDTASKHDLPQLPSMETETLSFFKWIRNCNQKNIKHRPHYCRESLGGLTK